MTRIGLILVGAVAVLALLQALGASLLLRDAENAGALGEAAPAGSAVARAELSPT